MNEIDTGSFATFLALTDTPAEMKTEAMIAEAEAADVVNAPVELSEDYDEYNGEMFDDNVEFLDHFADEDGYVADEETEEVEDSDEDGVEDEVEDADEVVEGEDPSDEAREYGEDMDVDYDTILTLPDGREITIEDLTNGYISGSDLEFREEKIQKVVQEFENRVAGMSDSLELCILEADRVIQDYDGFDWATLSLQDREAYVENMEFLNKYKRRREQLQGAFDKMKAEKDAVAQKEFNEQCRVCVETLQKTIPNWNEQLYTNLLEYAVEQGDAPERVGKENNPAFFQMLYKAYQFDKGKAQVTAKIKKAGAPKRVMKSEAKGGLPASSNPKDMAKARAAKAAKEGKLTKDDMFKYLVD